MAYYNISVPQYGFNNPVNKLWTMLEQREREKNLKQAEEVSQIMSQLDQDDALFDALLKEMDGSEETHSQEELDKDLYEDEDQGLGCDDALSTVRYFDPLIDRWERESRYHEEEKVQLEREEDDRFSFAENQEDSDEEDDAESENEDMSSSYDVSPSDPEGCYYLSNGKPYDTIEECPLGQVVQRMPLLCGGKKEKRRKKGYKRVRKRGRDNNMVKIGQLGLRNPATSTHFSSKVLDEWRYEQIIETDGAGNFSVAIALRNPTTALNGSGTYTRSQGFANLYDEYKVVSVGVIVDFLVNNPATGFGRMAVDFDSVFAGPYTGADLLGNEYMREFQGYNQISFASRVPKLASGSYRGQPVVITQGGYYDFNTPPDEGQIIMVGERYPAGGRIANVTLTMRVVMRRRRTINQAKEERLRFEEERREKFKK